MTDEVVEEVPPPDPGNAPPEEWLGEPIGLQEEQDMINAALAVDVRAEPYEEASSGL